MVRALCKRNNGATDMSTNKNEQRNSFRQDAISAWRTYQADGLHATQTDTDYWLAKLELGDDSALPNLRHRDDCAQMYVAADADTKR